MNYLARLKITTVGLLIMLMLFCIGLLPKAQVVSPAPDGGYPGFNTAEGQNALKNLTTGSANTGVGWFSLWGNATGEFNTATGAGALLFNNGDPTMGEASENTAFGAAALLFNTTGGNNTAIGAAALLNNTTGGVNTAIGYAALGSNTTGVGNTAVGRFALAENSTGSLNIALGYSAGSGVSGAANVICIGANVSGEDVSDSCYIGQIFDATSSFGAAVFVNSNNRLGTLTSSRRFKEEIKPMDKASETLFALKPVAFRYKKKIDPAGTSQFGLVAEDVEKVNPGLVVRDKEGKAYSVRYEQINAMLLNEFLKEHRKVEEQAASIAGLKSAAAKQETSIADFKSTIARQQTGMEALTAYVKAQAAEIQRVSAQMEPSKAVQPVAKISE